MALEAPTWPEGRKRTRAPQKPDGVAAQIVCADAPNADQLFPHDPGVISYDYFTHGCVYFCHIFRFFFKQRFKERRVRFLGSGKVGAL